MKKAIFKVEVHDEKMKKKAMKTVCGLPGVGSISMDMERRKLTVTGDFDTIDIGNKLRKICWTEILSLGPAKEPGKKEEQKKEKPKKADDKKKEEPKKEEPKKADDKKKEKPKKEEPKKADDKKKKEEPKKEEPKKADDKKKKEEPKKEEPKKADDKKKEELLKACLNLLIHDLGTTSSRHK